MKEQTPVTGSICQSLQGRDKGNYYIVVGSLPNGWVLVADGLSKPLSSPKKKNGKHLRYFKARSEEIETALTSGSAVENCDIAHILKQFAQKLSTKSAAADGK